jgi:pectinesterase
MGPFMWIRNTDANHGNVFVHCIFIARERAVPQNVSAPPAPPPGAPRPPPMGAVFARLPNNHGLNYPYAEAVLIDCKLKGVPPIGWGPIEDETSHLHLWEFNSTGLDGHPVDTSLRHEVSKQLTMPRDAETIREYSDPAFVLGGWKPVAE